MKRTGNRGSRNTDCYDHILIGELVSAREGEHFAAELTLFVARLRKLRLGDRRPEMRCQLATQRSPFRRTLLQLDDRIYPRRPVERESLGRRVRLEGRSQRDCFDAGPMAVHPVTVARCCFPVACDHAVHVDGTG